MPRNSAGVYSLPPTNPVVPFTTITTSWANPTLSDIATALTDSLDRQGRGGMLAPFKVFDGTVSLPGLGFNNEPSLGIWRSGSGVMNMASSGASLLQVGPDRLVSLVKLEHRGLDTYKATGFKNWKMANEAGELIILPSATADAEDWDITKLSSFDPDTGQLEVPSLNVIGSISAGTWTFVDITCNTLTVTGGNIQAGTNGFVGGFCQVNQYGINARSATQATATTINFTLSQSWVITLSGPLIISSLSGLNVGNIGRMTFLNTDNGVSFPPTVRWPGPSFVAPDFAAGPLNKAIVTVEWDGTNFLANASVY